MEKRRITYDNELEIMIEDYLANPLEAELERVIEGLEEEELAERRAKVQSVLEGREKFEIPSAQILHNIMEVWRAFRPSVYKKLKRMEIMPLEAERLLQEQGRIKSKLPYNRGKVSQYCACLLFHGFMRLRLRNSGLRPSDSLAAAAHFISWNDTNAHNVLLNPCTLFVFNNLFSLQKPRLPYGDRGFGLPEAAGSPLSHSS